MSKKVEVELNSAGIQELLKSAEIEAICREYADQVRDRAGDGYEVNTQVGKTRVNAMVFAASGEAARDNLKNNTLLKALGG